MICLLAFVIFLYFAVVAEFEEERAFVWDDYLEDTKSSAASATSFKHVSVISDFAVA